jgi:hypothetical protein
MEGVASACREFTDAESRRIPKHRFSSGCSKRPRCPSTPLGTLSPSTGSGPRAESRGLPKGKAACRVSAAERTSREPRPEGRLPSAVSQREPLGPSQPSRLLKKVQMSLDVARDRERVERQGGLAQAGYPVRWVQAYWRYVAANVEAWRGTQSKAGHPSEWVPGRWA